MSLLAYNLTTAPLALAAGTPIVTLPASSVTGARSVASNVTGELKGLLSADYTLLQAQVAAGQVQYEWSTGVPEFPVGSLVVGQVAVDVAESPVDIYVNGATGNDANPGSSAAPVATLAGAHALVPGQWKRRCRIIMDADGVNRSYAYPGPSGLGFQQPLGLPVGPFGTPIQYLGNRTTLVPQQAETVGGSNNTATIAVPATTITDNPLSSAATTINVTSTAGFQSAGWLKVDSELIRYTGVTATSFTGCVRGQAGTAAAAHLLAASIFQFLAGHYLQQTANNTTLTDNPLSAVAVTVNVASTTGYPSASTIRIDDELITYTGKTATSFTGCTRGTNNTTATVHNLGATVRLIGQRRSIKTNTATTVTVTNNFSVVNAVGDTFTINTAGTTIVFPSISSGPLVGMVLIKDCIITGTFGASSGLFTYRGCNAILTGGNAFTYGSQGGVVVGGIGAHLPDGAENPALSQEDNSNLRVEGQNTSHIVNAVTIRGSSRFVIVGNLVTVNALVAIDTVASPFNLLVCLHGGAVVVKEGGYMRLDNVAATNKCLLSGAQLVVQRGGIALVNRFDINNVIASGAFVPTGSAIVVEQGGYLDISEMTGTGNAGYGVECRDGIVRSRDLLSTVTGTLGDLKCGSRPVRTWADFNAVNPPSGLPSKTELDVPGFVARPFKISFAGLVAADSFDITTLAAFATPASASAVLSSIWQGTPPAIQNASTLRVTAGTAGFLGTYALSDAGATPISAAGNTVVGVATLSDDGKTITFPAGTLATAFTIEYLPIAGLAQASASMGGRIYQQNINT